MRVFCHGTIELMTTKRIIFIPILIIFCIAIGGLIYLLIFKKSAEKPLIVPGEKTLEEKLKEITAPAGGIPEVSEEILKSLTAPKKGEAPSEEILKSLTAPTK